MLDCTFIFLIILKPNHLVLEKGLSDIFLFYESNKVIKDFFYRNNIFLTYPFFFQMYVVKKKIYLKEILNMIKFIVEFIKINHPSHKQ